MKIASPTDRSEDPLYARVFGKTVPLLVLCYMIAYLDRVNVGFAKLQMAGDLHFSERVYGLGAGIFFFGYFVFQVPSNLILQRVGARAWISLIMVAWGLIAAVFAFIKSSEAFYFLRFLLGAAEAGFYPGVVLYLTTWFPPHRRARVMAILSCGIALAGIVGNPLSGWIMDRFHGAAGLRGWQWMFILEAVPAVLAGAFLFFHLDNRVGEAKWLSVDEKALIERNLSPRTGEAGMQQSVSAVFRDLRVWAMCFIYFTFVMGQYGMTFWIPTLVKASGVTGNFSNGMLSAIPYLVAIVAMVLVSRSADARRERRWHLVVPVLVGAAGFVGAALNATNTPVALAFISAATAGVLTCIPLFWSLPTAFLRGPAAASGIAIINSVGNLAGFASPYLVGYLKDFTHDNRTGMFMLAGILVLGAAAVLRVPASLANR